MDKVKIIDLKTYFTQPSLYPEQSRKFWQENQAAILEFIGALEDKGSFLNMHSFMARVDNYLRDPYVCDSRESYLILGKPLDISAYDYGDARLQKLVTDHVLASVDRELPFVVVSVPRADDKSQGRFYHDCYTEQQKRERSDPWGHVTNDMLVHLLSHFSLTQIHPFQPHGQRVQVPSGLELVELIQSRLMPPDYRGGEPFAAFNQFFDPRFSGGYRPFPRCWNGGNAAMNGMNMMFNQMNIPQASNGAYARHAFTGVWTWYPHTGVYANIILDHKGDDQKLTLQTLLNEIYKFVARYGVEYEPHISLLVKEVCVTFEHDPKALELLKGTSVTLFIGERGHIEPTVRGRTNDAFTNWALADGAWVPGKEYKPTKVINVIDGVAKYIPGYGNEGFGGRPGCW